MKTLSTLVMVAALLLAAACESEQTVVPPPGSTSTDATDGNDGTDGIDASTASDGTDSTDGPCVADCAGRSCGPDGCGGFCGFCSQGATCESDGTCSELPCTPKCEGRECGPDGCGEECGTCEGEASCNGAGQCDDGSSGCTPDCEGKECGDDGCGNQCGKCPAGNSCTAGICEADNSACGPVDEVGECQQNDTIAVTCKAGQLVAVVCDPNKNLTCGYNQAKNKYDCLSAGCTPSCDGKECGADGCGGLCGQCKPNETCNANGQCQVGDTCTPNCSGKQCGPDGCGGQCGICGAGKTCSQGVCIDPNGCVPACSGKQCGPDGCGGSCGTCKPDETCTVGKCIKSTCQPNCVGKQCGPDGCGGQCGSCADNQVCDTQGHCVITGGGACGALTYEGRCKDDGVTVEWCESNSVKTQDCSKLGDDLVCAWVPNQETYWCVDQCVAACANKECGDDGCGGQCGICGEGKACSASGVCVTEGGGGECGDVSFEGICEGITLKYCSGGTLNVVNCGEYGKSCGWDPNYNWNACIAPDGCVPNCLLDSGDPDDPNVKECGDDGCGNLCGVCAPGLSCDAGTCVEGGGNCGDVTVVGECEGDELSYCLDGQLYEVDCAQSDQVCGFEPSGNDGNGWYDCLQPGEGGGGTSCGDLSQKGVCVGSTLHFCSFNGAVSYECDPKLCLFNPTILDGNGGYVCEPDPGCASTCPADQRCQIDGTCGCDGVTVAGHCEENTLVYCLGDKLTIQDCTTSGETCGKTGSYYDCQ